MTLALSVLCAVALASAGAAIGALIALAVVGLAMVARGLRDGLERERQWREARRRLVLRHRRLATARLVQRRWR